MNDARALRDLVRMSREWWLPALVLLAAVAIVAVSLAYLPQVALSLERESFKRYSRSVAGVLGLEERSEILAAQAKASIDPRVPKSRDGREQLTSARQAAAAALHDLRALHKPIGAEAGQARLDLALVSWGKSLEALEGGYATATTQGWILAIVSNYESAGAAEAQLADARFVLVERARAMGCTFNESASSFGLSATRLSYQPTLAATGTQIVLVPEEAYKTRLRTVMVSYATASAGFKAAAAALASTERDAASRGPTGFSSRAVRNRLAAADLRMQRAMLQAQAASVALGTIPDPSQTQQYAAGQRNLNRAARTLAFVVMPGELRTELGLLSARLSPDPSPAGERRVARLVAEKRRLARMRTAAESQLKRAQPTLPFLAMRTRG
jgi:hypothetical protein